jgi:hypothetical protein
MISANAYFVSFAISSGSLKIPWINFFKDEQKLLCCVKQKLKFSPAINFLRRLNTYEMFYDWIVCIILNKSCCWWNIKFYEMFI